MLFWKGGPYHVPGSYAKKSLIKSFWHTRPLTQQQKPTTDLIKMKNASHNETNEYGNVFGVENTAREGTSS